jgi:preprotein translocase subunit SecD
MVGRILLLGLTLGSCARLMNAQSQSAPRVSLEYRWVGDGAVGPVYRVVDATSGQAVLVSDSVVLALRGVARAEVAAHGRGMSSWDVIVRLTPRAAQAFDATTEAHAGRRLAVLVDGRVVQIATVTTRLGRVAGVVAGVPRGAADSLAARLNGAIGQAER